jgi:hypothetical protein
MSRIGEIQEEMLRIENILSDKLKKWQRSTGEVYADLEWAIDTLNDAMSVVIAASDGAGNRDKLRAVVDKFKNRKVN